MTPERWRRVRDLFDQALDLPVGERRGFLLVSADGDRELVHEVESLLQSFRESEDLMNEPAAAALGGLVSEISEASPAAGGEPAEGMLLLEHCDQSRLSIDDRLRLFLRVCEAGESTAPERVSREKFRLASDGRIELVPGAREPAAPDYLSPEEASGLTVSPFSTVYSLGAVLHFLLTGRSPYSLRHRTTLALLTAIRHDPVTAPSQRVLKDEDFIDFDGWTRSWNAKELADLRGESVANLGKRLEGDLDAIILAALKKNPEERYGSASDLAKDVERCLQGRPVLAREQTFLYRAGKLVQRGLRFR